MNEQSRDEEAIFLAALEKTTPQERDAFAEAACAGDQKLLERVRELLDSHDDSAGPLDSPPMGVTATITQPIPEKPGTRIGPYKLLQQIGEGGFGVVYMAEQIEPVRRKVALKIIKPGMDTKEVVARFEAERQALALMDHPNIAKVLDGGATESGRPYFVMELVKGVPLTEFCDANKLKMPQRLQLFTAVCRAVQHAHHKGVIHRDLKPSNVMVTLHDGSPVPKVIDFGVSKAISQQLTEKTLFTAYGQMIGTPAYMSPEQAEMSGLDIDTRSDIYSLGVLLYELLTGSTPLDANDLRGAAYVEMQRIIREEEPPKPSTRLSTLGEATASIAANRGTEPKKLDALVRGDLDWIVMRALEKDRERRYESANSFANDIERFLNRQPVDACPPSFGYKLRSYVRRNKQAILVTGAIHALLFIGIVVSVVLTVRMLNERDRANSAESLAQNRLAEVQQEQEKTRGALKVATRERDRAVAAERQEANRRLEAQGQKDEAERQRSNAEKQARIANSRRLAARSREVLHEHPELGLLLAVEALETSWRHDEPHVPVAEQTLRDALATVGGTPLNQRGIESRVVTMNSTWIVTQDAQATHFFNLSAADPNVAPLRFEGERALSSRGSDWLVTVDPEKTVRVRDLRSEDAVPTTVLRQHEGTLDRAIASPDGHWLVTSTTDGITRLWNVSTGNKSESPHVLKGHKFWTISHDSRWLATEGEGGRVHLWNLAIDNPTDAPLALEMRGDVGQIRSVVFGANSRWLVAGSRKKSRVWDLNAEQPAKLRMLLSGTDAEYRGGEEERRGDELFSSNGRWLLLPGHRESTLWDMSEKDPDASPITLQSPQVYGKAIFSPDDNVLVMGARSWNLTDERLAQRPRGSKDASGLRVVMYRAAPTLIQQERSWFAAFDPQMRWVVHAFSDKRIGVWDLLQISEDTGSLRRSAFILSGHEDHIMSLEFSPDGRWLLSEGEKGTVRMWDFARAVPSTSPLYLRKETAVSVSPNGRWLATTHFPHGAKLWDLTAADPSKTPIQLTGHTSMLREASFSPDGRWLVTVDRDVNMQMWDLKSDDLSSGVSLFRQKQIRADIGRGFWWPFRMKFSDDSRWLYAAPGLEANLWDLTAEKPGSNPIVLGGHERVPTLASFSPNGRWLITSDGMTPVRLWNLAADDPTGEPTVFGDDQTKLRFAEFDFKSRRLITVARNANAPCLWDLSATNPAATSVTLLGHKGAMTNQPVLSPDRRWLATTGTDKTARVWDLQKPNEVGSPFVLRGVGESLVLHFSPDSRWLLGKDDDTHVWDLAADDPSATATVVEGRLRSISPDSRWLVAGSKRWSLTDGGPKAMPTTLVRTSQAWPSEFSPDGRWLAVYGTENVRLFDLPAAKSDAVPILLTGVLREQTQVSRQQLDKLPMPFSAGGRWLISFGGSDSSFGGTLLFNLRIRELVEIARRTAGRKLTDEEMEFFSLNDPGS
jgi:serine/threonine protein kinase/WD40 repeat protein